MCFEGKYPQVGGTTLSSLLKIARSQWLELQINELLRQSFETSCRVLGTGQTAPTIRGTQTGSESLSDHPSRVVKTGPEDERQSCSSPGAFGKSLRRISFLVYPGPVGTIQIYLQTRSGEEIGLEESTQPFTVTVTCIPKTSRRSKGLSATFARMLNISRAPPISPIITTFNVISLESDIFRCAIENDLSGMQKLFDAKEASPLDVDPFGVSLLWVLYLALNDQNTRY